MVNVSLLDVSANILAVSFVMVVVVVVVVLSLTLVLFDEPQPVVIEPMINAAAAKLKICFFITGSVFNVC